MCGCPQGCCCPSPDLAWPQQPQIAHLPVPHQCHVSGQHHELASRVLVLHGAVPLLLAPASAGRAPASTSGETHTTPHKLVCAGPCQQAAQWHLGATCRPYRSSSPLVLGQLLEVKVGPRGGGTRPGAWSTRWRRAGGGRGRCAAARGCVPSSLGGWQNCALPLFDQPVPRHRLTPEAAPVRVAAPQRVGARERHHLPACVEGRGGELCENRQHACRGAATHSLNSLNRQPEKSMLRCGPCPAWTHSLVVEAHAAKDVTDVRSAQRSVGQAAIGRAGVAIGLVGAARGPWDRGAWQCGCVLIACVCAFRCQL